MRICWRAKEKCLGISATSSSWRRVLTWQSALQSLRSTCLWWRCAGCMDESTSRRNDVRPIWFVCRRTTLKVAACSRRMTPATTSVLRSVFFRVSARSVAELRRRLGGRPTPCWPHHFFPVSRFSRIKRVWFIMCLCDKRQRSETLSPRSEFLDPSLCTV